MQIHYDHTNRIWIAESSYAEKDAVKQAGFWWHPSVGNCRFDKCKACAAGLVKKWWTFKPEAAIKLLDYCTDEAKQALSSYVDAVNGSKASDADIDIPCPDGLAYRPFQKAGIAYAQERDGVLIGDEMGLGKTIQALGLINLRDKMPVLVIVPASLRLNWQREAKKWLVKQRSIVVVDSQDVDVTTADIVIINYDRIKGEMFNKLMDRDWDMLIADEVHMVKNPKAQRTQRVLGHYDRRTKTRTPGLVDRAKTKLFLTGTPILNRPIEVQPIAGALAPRQFGNFFKFAKRYCDAYRTRYGWDFSGASNLDELQTKLRSTIMVRRLKADVLSELPPFTRSIITLPPNGMKGVVEAEQSAWDSTADTQLSFDEYFDELEADVELAKAAGDDAAYKAAVARLDSAIRVAFEEMSKVRHQLAVAKIPAVLDHCDNVLNELDKLVVFAHHHDVIEALQKHYDHNAVVLYGNTPNRERDAAVEAFQTDPNVKVFIGSIKAAGLGLTLTAASHVVFAELDWVPAAISQAESRLHRMGQKCNVTVQHLVIDGSLDAKLAAVLLNKQAVIDAALDSQADKIEVPEVPKKTNRKYPVATDDQREAAAYALQMLAGMCDGAYMLDGAGFNKFDTRMGKQLAARSLQRPLTDGEVHLCRRLLPKYHRQIGRDIIDRIKGG
jgi:SWI/SNF-related matrix-associated actin-dependent regulator 1 of chromatin subfamily A